MPALDAPVPLVVEQLADVLLLVEVKEREEDARMDQLKDMMFSGQSVSAADREAWRRWAQAGSTQRRRKRKKKLPKTSLRHAARVPAVLLRVLGGASVPVHRPCAGHFSCMQRQVRTVHTVQAIGDSTGSVLGLARSGAPTGVIVQTVQKTVDVPQLPSPVGFVQFLDKVHATDHGEIETMRIANVENNTLKWVSISSAGALDMTLCDFSVRSARDEMRHIVGSSELDVVVGSDKEQNTGCKKKDRGRFFVHELTSEVNSIENEVRGEDHGHVEDENNSGGSVPVWVGCVR